MAKPATIRITVSVPSVWAASLDDIAEGLALVGVKGTRSNALEFAASLGLATAAIHLSGYTRLHRAESAAKKYTKSEIRKRSGSKR